MVLFISKMLNTPTEEPLHPVHNVGTRYPFSRELMLIRGPTLYVRNKNNARCTVLRLRASQCLVRVSTRLTSYDSTISHAQLRHKECCEIVQLR